MPAKLVISRTSGKDIKIRGLFVLVDGEEVANVAYGKTFEMVLAPGEHKLKVTNNLYSKSFDLDLKEGETASFVAINVLSGFWALVLGWSGIVPYKVVLERTNG